MVPLHLRAHDFLAFAELDLDLRTVHAAAIVGPNGAGKSTLMDVALWTLFGEGRVASPDKLIRRGADSAWASSTWRIRHHEVTVTRTRTRGLDSALTLEVDGAQATRHTIRETEAAIAELVGLDADALLVSSFMRQDESGAFMRLRPSPRRDLLIQLFALDRFTAYAQEAGKEFSRIEATLAALAAERVGHVETTDGEADARETMRLVAAELVDVKLKTAAALERSAQLREEVATLRERASRAADLKGQIDAANARLDRNRELAKNTVRRVALAKTTLAREPVADVDEKEHQKVTLAAAAAEDEIKAIIRAEAEREGAASTLERLSRDAALLTKVPCHGEGIYAACPLLINATRAVKEIDHHQTKIAASEAIVAHKAAAQLELTATRARLIEMTRQAEQARGDLRQRADATQVLAETEQLVKQTTTAILEDDALIPKLNAERLRLAQDETRIGEAVSELNRLTDQVNAGQKRIENLESQRGMAERVIGQIDKAKERIAAIDQETTTTTDDLIAYQTLARIWNRNALPTLILEGAIPTIEQRANDVLDRLPGGFRLSLPTQRELSSGRLRDELEVRVMVEGFEQDYELCSGGERFRLDFALRVALAGTLARRHGSEIRTLWIDEGFGSQDDGAKEALVSCMAQVAGDFDLMLVASHVPEIVDRFPARIRVVPSDSGSTALVD